MSEDGERGEGLFRLEDLDKEDVDRLKRQLRKQAVRELEAEKWKKGETNVSNVNRTDENHTFHVEIDQEGSMFPPRCTAGVVKMGRVLRCQFDAGHDVGEGQTPHTHVITVDWWTYLPAPTIAPQRRRR